MYLPDDDYEQPSARSQSPGDANYKYNVTNGNTTSQNETINNETEATVNGALPSAPSNVDINATANDHNETTTKSA